MHVGWSHCTSFYKPDWKIGNGFIQMTQSTKTQSAEVLRGFTITWPVCVCFCVCKNAEECYWWLTCAVLCPCACGYMHMYMYGALPVINLCCVCVYVCVNTVSLPMLNLCVCVCVCVCAVWEGGAGTSLGGLQAQRWGQPYGARYSHSIRSVFAFSLLCTLWNPAELAQWTVSPK